MNKNNNVLHNLHPIRRLKYRFGVYQSRKNHCFKAVVLFVVLTIVVFAVFLGIERRIAPIAFKTGEAQLKNGLTLECNRILSEVTAEKFKTSDIMTENRDADGRVTSVSVNFGEVNRIKTYSAQRIAEYLKGCKNIGCSVPMGSLVSDGILSGYGFEIPLNLVCTAELDVNFEDDFVSAGVNQVRHRLMISVVVNATLCSITESTPVRIVTDIPLAETVISGDVPVLNNQTFGNGLSN